MLEFSQIKKILSAIGIDGTLPKEYCHEYYDEAINIKKEIAKVFGDEYPDYLEINRPREKKAHKDYRKAVYKNTQKSFLSKNIARLDYIPESDDFAVKWRDDPQAEKLKQFEKKAYAIKGNFQEWFFDFVKTDFVIDPNAVLVFVPSELPSEDSMYYNPQAEIIGCENVYVYQENKLCVVRSSQEVLVFNEFTNKIEKNGLLLYFFDDESYTVARETKRSITSEKTTKSTFTIWGLKKDFNMETGEESVFFKPLLHFCNQMPCKKIGKIREKKNGKGEQLYVSTISNSLPHIKDAQARYNDIQVEFNYHVNSQEWRMSTRPCQAEGCNKGRIPVRNNMSDIIGHKICESCHGTGMEIGGSALDFIVYSMPKKDGFTDDVGSVPAVPGGFIPRPIESVRELVSEYKRKVEEAYADVHMQFHNRTPLVESGTAKEVDREEFYRETIVLAKHLCWLLQWSYEMQARFIFGYSGLNEMAIPMVLTPSRFMLSGMEETRKELNEALQNKYDPVLVAAIQARMLEYQTGKDSEAYKRFVTRQQIDPYREMSVTEKVFQFGIASQVAEVGSDAHALLVKQFILSLQFNSLVDEAEMLYPDFYQKSPKEKKEILLQLLEKYAAAIPTSLALPRVFDTTVDIQNANQTAA